MKVMGKVKMRVRKNDKGYMDGIYDETMREVEEEFGLLRSGVRFQQEKRKRNKKSPSGTEIRNYERRSPRTKRPSRDKGDDHVMLEYEEGPTQSNNVPTLSCTTPHSGRNTRSSQDCPMCHHHNNTSE